MLKELTPDQLRLTIDPQTLNLESTEHLKPVDGIIGQHRAVSALRFGLGIQEVGFNIFVAGPRGIGKMTAVKSFLEELALTKPAPNDWCYVNNFDDPYQPTALELPPGKGKEFQQDMRLFIEYVSREIPKSFESDEYGKQRDEIQRTLNERREAVLKQFSIKAGQQGFALHATQLGIVLVPVKDGKPMSETEWNALPQPEQDTRMKIRETLQDELKEAIKQTRDVERTTQNSMLELDRQVILYQLSGVMEELTEKYKDQKEVLNYIDAIQIDMLSDIDVFKPGQDDHVQERDLDLTKYQVNLLVDNSKQQGAPVVVELHPTYTNLFGRVEKEVEQGTMYTDFTMIKPGALHRANGGYIVLPVEDVLRNHMSWDGLRRALRSQSIVIEEMAESLGMSVAKSQRPQPIRLDVKVLLVGRPMFYYMMHSYDEEFPELFKVKADFDTSMPRTENNIREFLMFISMLCRKENLKHLDAGAAARLLEHASRFAEDQEKLSTHFGAIADVIREAHFWAAQEQAAPITAIHVRKALEEKIYRSNLIEEHIREMITRKILVIDTTSEIAGQVNGLAVIRMGEYEFGRPSRITVTVAPGTEGIVDIERQVALGGPIHSKGVLILSGYLARMFAIDKPLTLSAKLVFEQSYEGVDGDSASSTELYALLSALANAPIRQGIAVTGSVDQYGTVQAIGGANEKIEGYFDICRAFGLTGKQGVIIPKTNLKHLMLRDDVVDAVRDGLFHIWAVSTIAEGIEILTGKSSGAIRKNGNFPKGSIYDRVDKRLKAFRESVKKTDKKKSGEKKK